MRVLIHEQDYLGHHYHYLALIIPALAETVEEVVVTVSEHDTGSHEFRRHLAPLADRVDIRPILPPGAQSLSYKERFRLLRDLRDAVRHVRPDYLLVPSGDRPTTAMGLARPVGRGGLPGRVPAEVGIHYGVGIRDASRKDRLKDRIYAETQRLSPWTKIHYVSLTNYEWMKTQGPGLARRAALLPHPVPPSPRLEKRESRRRLGIPEDGRYIGLVGILDYRKAIPELLAAFRRAAGAEDRLLLTGRLDANYPLLIESDYADLVAQGRLIVRDGFFDQETQDLTLGALDVVCTPYPGFGQLSASMLEGVAAGRPVLVNDFGWMRAMVRRFGFGTACNVSDVDAFASAIRSSLDQAPHYRETEATRRLLAFHAPANFAAHWLQGIRRARGLPPAPIVTWASVEAALAAEGGPPAGTA